MLIKSKSQYFNPRQRDTDGTINSNYSITCPNEECHTNFDIDWGKEKDHFNLKDFMPSSVFTCPECSLGFKCYRSEEIRYNTFLLDDWADTCTKCQPNLKCEKHHYDE